MSTLLEDVKSEKELDEDEVKKSDTLTTDNLTSDSLTPDNSTSPHTTSSSPPVVSLSQDKERNKDEQVLEY